MLLELSIENFALIERLRLRPGAGLNVLTGETGAGKSIVIDAINAVLGERMGPDVIRSGAPRASVEAAFDLSEADDRRRELIEAGVLDAEESMLAVSRDFSTGGKNQCRVAGRLSPVSLLREVGRNLVDVHGQHEHQSLLNADSHIEILDDWCGRAVGDLRDECAAIDRRRRQLSRELAALRMGEREKAQRLDLLRFQAEEIAAARLQDGEEEELQNERRRLANMERLMSQVAELREILSGDAGDVPGAVDALGRAARLAADASRDDAALEPLVQSLDSALYTVQDAVQEVAAYHENLETNPTRLEEVEDRLELIRSLRRKYGDTITEILALEEQITREIAKVEGAEERELEISGLLDQITRQLDQVAAKLTAARKKGAAALEQRIGSELADLALAGACFQVRIEPIEPGSSGADRVEFLFSANPGEPARPLARIVSGGEMSRIMLALKSLLASSVGVPTVIFDEIDVGVGGRTGEAIGAKLQALGAAAQVICVTHLPQIAAMADQHFRVIKEVNEGRTTVRVAELSHDERLEELSRMLGGGKQTALKHAQDMLRQRKPVAGDRADPVRQEAHL